MPEPVDVGCLIAGSRWNGVRNSYLSIDDGERVQHMARKPRIHFPGALYHVIARGNRRQQIFLQDEDYRLYLRFLAEYKQRCPFLLFAYILMPDHIHLLLEVGEMPLARLMQSLQLRYSRNFNLKYNKKGHLFQGRYQAILCQKEVYLAELTTYIHLNGVRSGMVSDPGEYPWSSYNSYISRKRGQEDVPVDTETLLDQFEPGNRDAARQRYAGFVGRKRLQGHREDFYQLKDRYFLGSDEFVNTVRNAVNYPARSMYDITLPEIVSRTSLSLKIPIEKFYTASRNRQGALGRSVAGYLAKKLGGIRIKSVADHFDRDPVVISQGINRLEKRLLEEREILAAMARLERELVNGRKKTLTKRV